MEGGRTAGEGREGRGLVAGVRAAFRGRPRRASKSRSDPNSDETSCPFPTLPSTSTPSNQRSPKSPIIGWRKLKHKDNHKGKECLRSEEARVSERSGGECSRSQALRLMHHSSLPNYTNYTLNSCLGKVQPSRERNGGVCRSVEHRIQPREMSPSWQASKVVAMNKLKDNDNIDPCQHERLSQKCTVDDSVSDGVQDSDGGIEEAFASSDKRDGQQGTVVCHVREEVTEEGEGENNGLLCQSENVNDDLKDTLRSDDAYRENKCYDEAPLAHDREPWLRSALRYSLRVPHCPKNEVVVLALGVDQYVEEVFRFLEQSKTGRVRVEDFHALCCILGLEDGEMRNQVYKCRCVGSTLTLLGSLEDCAISSAVTEAPCPAHLSFREFRERLCEVFIRNADAHSLLSLGARRPANSPLVNSVVSVQRRYEVLEVISRKLSEVTARLKCEEEKLKEENCEPVCGKCQQVIHVDRNSNISPRPRDVEVSYLQRQVLLQQQELQCLREVIDDLRVALQSSDAENLALQVQALRLAQLRQQSSLQDLSLTDEENTIDNLVRQLAELDPQSIGAPQGLPCDQQKEKEGSFSSKDAGQPNASFEPLSCAFVPGDASLEGELQATYEALQQAREQREATQADLQQTVGQLQQREADLRRVEDSLQMAQSALGQAHADFFTLATEVAQARTSLDDSRSKLAQALSDLQQARDIILQKEKQLEEAQARLDQLRDSKARVVARVGTARELVAESLGQVKEGEHALATLAAHEAHTRLEEARRADSGLYSEDSERDEDTCQDRSSEHASASEEDLWSLRGSDASHKSQSALPALQAVASPWINVESSSSSSSSDRSVSNSNSGSDDGYKTETGESSLSSPFTESVPTSSCSSREIIEGLERELEWLQHTLEEAEREWQEEELRQTEDERNAKEETGKPVVEIREDEDDRARLSLLQDQLRQLLEALMSVADMNLSRRTLGRLVLEAVQDASSLSASPVNPGSEDEVPPISLLTRLLSSLSVHAPAKNRGESNEWLSHSALRGLAHPTESRERVEVTMG